MEQLGFNLAELYGVGHGLVFLLLGLAVDVAVDMVVDAARAIVTSLEGDKVVSIAHVQAWSRVLRSKR